MIIVPPIRTLAGGTSFKNNQTHIGANKFCYISPIVVDGVDLDPIVIHMKPNANWGTPRKKPIKIS